MTVWPWGAMRMGVCKDDGQVVGFGDPKVLPEEVLLELRARVQADLTYGDHALVLEKARELGKTTLGVGVVHAEKRDRERGEGLVAQGLRRGHLHGKEALPQKQHRVGRVRAYEHVRAGDDAGLHTHHGQLLQLHVLDHVGVKMRVDEPHYDYLLGVVVPSSLPWRHGLSTNVGQLRNRAVVQPGPEEPGQVSPGDFAGQSLEFRRSWRS